MNKLAKIITVIVGIVSLLVIMVGAISTYAIQSNRIEQTEAQVKRLDASVFVMREEMARSNGAIRKDLADIQVSQGRQEERLIALSSLLKDLLDRRPPPRPPQGRTPEP